MTNQSNTQADEVADHLWAIRHAITKIRQHGGNRLLCSDAEEAVEALRTALAAHPTPEPCFDGIAARKLADLQGQGYEVNGYSIQHAESGQRGFITTGGFVGWWRNMDHVQPTPEPPELGSAEHMAQSLFDHIQHGDETHRAWLREQSLVWVQKWLAQTAPSPVALQGRDGCELGCTDECKAKAHGCASECPALPWQPSQGRDERALFEAEMRCEDVWGHRSLKRSRAGGYDNWQVNLMWSVWQAARASLPVGVPLTPGQKQALEEQAFASTNQTEYTPLFRYWFRKALDMVSLPAGGVVEAWLSIDNLGERYLTFSKPNDTHTHFALTLATPQPSETQGRRQMTEAARELLAALDQADEGVTDGGLGPGFENGHGIEVGSRIAAARTVLRAHVGIPASPQDEESRA